jgi:biflaviolin synthase
MMSADTALADGPPPVRQRPAAALGTGFGPVPGGPTRDGSVTRIRLPDGEGCAWLVTRYDEVRRRTVTRLAPHSAPARGPAPDVVSDL